MSIAGRVPRAILSRYFPHGAKQCALDETARDSLAVTPPPRSVSPLPGVLRRLSKQWSSDAMCYLGFCRIRHLRRKLFLT